MERVSHVMLSTICPSRGLSPARFAYVVDGFASETLLQFRCDSFFCFSLIVLITELHVPSGNVKMIPSFELSSSF